MFHSSSTNIHIFDTPSSHDGDYEYYRHRPCSIVDITDVSDQSPDEIYMDTFGRILTFWSRNFTFKF